jgi:hypothetical protein
MPIASVTAHLEDKLEHLVRLLQDNAAGGPVAFGDATLGGHGLGTPLESNNSSNHSPDALLPDEEDDQDDYSDVSTHPQDLAQQPDFVVRRARSCQNQRGRNN